MERISVFDMLKVGIGPSSSHTMGPWRAAVRFLQECRASGSFSRIVSVRVALFGALAKTGKGHGTDIAILMGLRGEDPATCDTTQLDAIVQQIQAERVLHLLQENPIPFDPAVDVLLHYGEALPFHPNGLRFTAVLDDGTARQETYYSVGGGFVVQEGEEPAPAQVKLPYPADSAADILAHCQREGFPIWQMVLENEKCWRSEPEVRARLAQIWEVMFDAVYRGCHTEGTLPGGLGVMRRAASIHRKLFGDDPAYSDRQTWLARIKQRHHDFPYVVRWVSCFALAVNEENASFGRVVTAPTNGAAGVIPAVLMYYTCFYNASSEDIMRFLLVAGDIGSLFKKGATISAAMGGCQAEIGVSSAMAAAALCECLGGSVEQALMAAEIAMEHHLGLTCDPVGGLVQVPCIERNAMGAVKAITAATLALESAPQHAKVSLDAVIKTMWETAQDMNIKYKETAEGGLAVQIPVNLIEC